MRFIPDKLKLKRVNKKVMKKTCNALTSKGEKCRLPAGYQTIHKGVGRCKFHDGRDHVKKSAGDIKHDSSFVIIDRNINLINRYLDRLALGQSNIECNNIVTDCINEIAMVEKDNVTVIATEQGIQISTFNSLPEDDNVIFKEYMKLGSSIYKMFEKRADKILENYRDNKVKFEKQSVIDTNMEPSKTECDSNGDQSESKPENYTNICGALFYLLLFGGGIIISLGLTSFPDKVPLVIIIYAVILIGFPLWASAKGYWKFPTKEERKAANEERMRKWGSIKSAHIIRLERGLYTGLGNRRPYPHGRRTKKY